LSKAGAYHCEGVETRTVKKKVQLGENAAGRHNGGEERMGKSTSAWGMSKERKRKRRKGGDKWTGRRG